jgi:hypothetical protein
MARKESRSRGVQGLGFSDPIGNTASEIETERSASSSSVARDVLYLASGKKRSSFFQTQ